MRLPEILCPKTISWDLSSLDALNAVWAKCARISLLENVSGRQPRWGTEVRLGWNDKELHGLFLCQDEQIDFPYKGRYFHAGGRFVCLGKPKPQETVVSEFDLDTAFKSYFAKNRTPGITGIGFGIDTSKAGRGGAAAAFIKSIEFIGADGADAAHAPGGQ